MKGPIYLYLHFYNLFNHIVFTYNFYLLFEDLGGPNEKPEELSFFNFFISLLTFLISCLILFFGGQGRFGFGIRIRGLGQRFNLAILILSLLNYLYSRLGGGVPIDICLLICFFNLAIFASPFLIINGTLRFFGHTGRGIGPGHSFNLRIYFLSLMI